MIPFNRPYMTGKELWYIGLAHFKGHLAGDGFFTKKCQKWLESKTGACRALLTHSCTAALEMAAILADIQPGDEVIMPSYTFVSTANAFVLRGAIPVFVDIRSDTLNIDEAKIELAISEKTKAIVVMHYAGVACEMDAIMALADKHGLLVIEDAAQALMADYKGVPLGSIGHLGAFSFHETKNIIAGEGGALLINSPSLVERAEIIWEKGTDRSKFFRGQVDKYTWQDIGSSYLPSELTAGFLWAQLEESDSITQKRQAIWNRYDDGLSNSRSMLDIRCPYIPDSCRHNAHMYYLLLSTLEIRDEFITRLRQMQIHCLFHYIPLHSSPFGAMKCRTVDDLAITKDMSERLVRLPFWIGIDEHLNEIIEKIYQVINKITQ